MKSEMLHNTRHDWQIRLNALTDDRRRINIQAEQNRRKIQEAQYILAALDQVNTDIQDNQ